MAGIGQSTPGITSPGTPLATLDPVGAVVVSDNFAIQFAGSVVVTALGPNSTLVTIGGAIPDLANDTWFEGVDFAGTGVINIVKVTTGDDVQIGDIGSCVIMGGDCVQLTTGIAAPELQFFNDAGNFFVGFKAPGALLVSQSYVWPLLDGAPGEALITDGAGNLSFATPGVVVTGLPNTVAFYDALGIIDSAAAFAYLPAINALKLGASGTNLGEDSLSLGPGTQSQASGDGSIAIGAALNSGVIYTNGRGSISMGVADIINAVIITDAAAFGALARGYALDGGQIMATETGAHAYGEIDANGGISSITAQAQASTAFGFIDGVAGSAIVASGAASMAFGHITAAGCNIQVSVAGSIGFGRIATAGGSIIVQAAGCLAFGEPEANSIDIAAGATGSFAGGNPLTDRDTRTTQRGAFSFGDGTQATGVLSVCFGLTTTARAYGSLVLGRYNVEDAGESQLGWVSTDSLIIAGNGTGVGTEANAYELSKDGKVTQTAAQRNSAARSVAAGGAVSGRTDYTIYVDTVAAAGAVVLALPAGEDGLEYYVKDSTGSASSKNISFTPNGVDTVESSAVISNDFGSIHLRFFNGQWYVIGQGLGNGWVKYTVTHTQLQAAAITNDIQLFSLPLKGIIRGVVIRPTTEFTGTTGIYRVSVGIAGNLTKFAPLFRVNQAVTNTLNQASNVESVENFVVSTSVRIQASSSGNNLNNSTAGVVDVYVNWEVLP